MPHMAAPCAVTAGRKPAWADVLSGFRHLGTESTLVWSICQQVPCLMLCGEAFQESKRDVPVPFHEGRAAGQQPGSAAGARGGRTAETKPRPNVLLEGRGAGLPAERPSRSDC